MTDFVNANCLGSCNPPQIVNLSYAVSDMSSLKIYGNCDEYDHSELLYSYSIDNVCWSCFMSYDEVLVNTIELNSDFYIKVKVTGPICKVEIDGDPIQDYATQLDPGFNFTSEESSNLYNPYANTEDAVNLQQQLAENVSSIVGIPIYYFKLSPNAGSKDLTFKEYTLMDVESVKQIKLIVADGQMPSSKPEFTDWGLDFQTDWETEITKQSFATAFGNYAQPMEGDLIYIPMMKRMWMVNGAYEEKKDGFMWIATTFKVALVKYQEKDSVELGNAQTFVDSIVKNKYEDLFGEDEETTRDSGETSINVPIYSPNRLYPVYRSDATRKYVTCDSIDVMNNDIYVRGSLISDTKYKNPFPTSESTIIYQKKYCGDELSLSFLLNFEMLESKTGTIIEIGNIKINYTQEYDKIKLFISNVPNIELNIISGDTCFIIFKWSKKMNIIDASAYRYDHIKNVPIYKLTGAHYYFDIDNPIDQISSKYDIELSLTEQSEVKLHGIYGWITNFKLFDLYNDNISELLRMFPNNQHLAINDTARRILDLPGIQV